MPTPRVSATALLGILAFNAHAGAQQPARDSLKLYAELCAGCHGAGLEGGSAPALLGSTWKHGDDDAALAASIRTGHPEAGMPAFGQTVSEKEIRSLVVYIREQSGRAAARRSPPPPSEASPASSRLHAYRVETAVTGLREPWSISFLPDGRMLVTEKRGTLRVVVNGSLIEPPVSGLPAVGSGGQAGLFDVVAHPDFARNGWLYLAFADPQKNAEGNTGCMTSVVRGRLKDNAWTDQEVIFRAPLNTFRGNGGPHYGGRLAFDREGYLFFSIGDRGMLRHAQDPTLPNGKIHRVHDDGRIPADNPFAETPGAIPSIWSYGNRNPQGLRLDPATGELWEHEHGPRGGDELNLIKRAANYGWPVATFGMNYNGTPITDVTARVDFESPVTSWVPSIAPCGMAFYTGDRFPKWKNHLFVTSLAAQELRRLELKAGKVIDQEIIFKGLGRLRDVITGPDGFLYLLLPNRVIRLVPATT